MALQTTVTELGDSKVKIDVEVGADVLANRVDRAAKALAGDLRVPGFRKGKVPPQIVIQRVGRDAVLEEALRGSLPEWYEQALLESGVRPVGDPKLDVGQLPGEGEDLRFSIEVGVRPKARLGDYKGLEVGRAALDVPDEAVDSELERLREGFASLAPVKRAAAPDDSLLIDFEGTIDGEPFEGSQSKDFLIELGAEGLLPEFDAALAGASAGDERTVEVTFPDDHRPEELAGKTAVFEVAVKEVREKDLPALDDDFAAEASEFETLDELRDHIRGRISEAFERRADAEFREAAVDAAAANATLEIPHELVHARAHEMWERVERQLTARGIDPQAYARMQGKERHDLIDEAEGDAEKALRREAVLEAVADAEGIEPKDEDLIEALGPGDGDDDPAKLLERLRSSGRDALLRDEVRMRRAVDVIAESAQSIPLEQAEARERIWTPDKEAEDEGAEKGTEAGRLWTPGS
jgi:trigger factor